MNSAHELHQLALGGELSRANSKHHGPNDNVIRTPRWLRILIRTVHIGSAAMLLGAATFDQAIDPWAGIVLLSGGAIVISDLLKYGSGWFRYAQGWAVLVKLALVVVGLLWPPLLVPGLWACLVVGSVISHAPGTLRHFAFWGPHGPCGQQTKASRKEPASK